MNRKLAVFFPGVGYHKDKPLLYYTRKAATQNGYEVINVSYDFSENAGDIKGNTEKMKAAFETALRQTEEQLKTVEFGKYDRVVFVGKSVGTVVAAYYSKMHKVDADQVILTPVPQTFDFLKDTKGILFHGTSDPWCENGIADDACKSLGVKHVMIDDANHSLETVDVLRDISIIQSVIGRINQYLVG